MHCLLARQHPLVTPTLPSSTKPQSTHAFAGLFSAGSEDGTARIWDLRSRQCLRSISSPNRAPVTAALLLLLLPAGSEHSTCWPAVCYTPSNLWHALQKNSLRLQAALNFTQ
jgi:WD40 repeat protein